MVILGFNNHEELENFIIKHFYESNLNKNVSLGIVSERFKQTKQLIEALQTKIRFSAVYNSEEITSYKNGVYLTGLLANNIQHYKNLDILLVLNAQYMNQTTLHQIRR